MTAPVSAVPVETASAAEPIVVMIDPGHGGSNLGTDYLPIPEKVYTMVVAQYMKEELEKFQNVEVYLTHTEDVKMRTLMSAQLLRRASMLIFSFTSF